MAPSLHEVRASHYRVACARCPRGAFVCPERATDLGMWARVVRAFERAGWFQTHDESRKRPGKGRSRIGELGEGTWYCTECRGKLR